MIGLLTIETHRQLQKRGCNYHVFVRGIDVTARCQCAYDGPAPFAVLLKKNAYGHSYTDPTTGKLAREIVTEHIEVREVVK